MNIKIYPSTLTGTIEYLPSKSYGHRIIIAALLALLQKDKTSGCLDERFLPSTFVRDLIFKHRASDDIIATFSSCQVITSTFLDGETGKDMGVNCNESGTTFRLLLPVVSTLFNQSQMILSKSLYKRPWDALKDELEKNGVMTRFLQGFDDEVLIEIDGKLNGGDFTIPGNISSQFLSGLLFALPITAKGGTITIEGTLQSQPYVDITLHILKAFGIKVKIDELGLEASKSVENSSSIVNRRYVVEGNKKYLLPKDLGSLLETDWSNGAFWLAANHFGSHVSLVNLKEDSLQGDKAIAKILKAMEDEGLETLDCMDIPDLVPIIAVAASKNKASYLTLENIDRLKYKESDRIASTLELINSLGGSCKYENSKLIVKSVGVFNGDAIINSHNDHRIAMAAAIASINCKHPIVIRGAEAVDKSYPDFWADYKNLGGKIIEI